MSEWIEHDGKGAPNLPPGALVHTRREFGKEEDSGMARRWEWWHGDGKNSNWIWPNGRPEYYSIVAYRVVTQ